MKAVVTELNSVKIYTGQDMLKKRIKKGGKGCQETFHMSRFNNVLTRLFRNVSKCYHRNVSSTLTGERYKTLAYKCFINIEWKTLQNVYLMLHVWIINPIN